MRWLVNENVPREVVGALRANGDDVLWAKESLRGRPDEELLARAGAEQRVLVTQDKDFGELAFRAELPALCGVVLFRLAGAGPDEDVRHMLAVLQSDAPWAGHFVVVTPSRIRVRELPR